MASDGVTNLSSHRKADALVRRFGARGFDYAGNSRADVPVWQQARRAVPVAASASVRRAAARIATVEREFAQAPAGLPAWLRALRLHQWVKNLLVFLTLLASHRFLELPLLASTVVAFFAFGLCASSVYVLNDLIDIQSDRVHPRKRNRPFAAGTLSPVAGLVVSLGCLVGAFALGFAAGAGLRGLARRLSGGDAALHLPAQAQDPRRRPGAGGAVYLARRRGRRRGRHVARFLAARAVALPLSQPCLRQALLRTRGRAAAGPSRARTAATTSSPTCR